MSRTVDITIPGALTEALGLTHDQLSAKLLVLAEMARARWIALAQERLRSTAEDYVGGIQSPVLYNNARMPSVDIDLKGTFNNWIEWGHGAWDLRDTVLNGEKAVVTEPHDALPDSEALNRKVKTSKAGNRYMSIPFRHQGEDTVGVFAAPMGKPYAAYKVGGRGKFSGAQAAQIRDVVSKVAARLRGGRSLSATETAGMPFLSVTHGSPLYAGMRRTKKQYEKANQSTFSTFRTISDNPNAKGFWLHPGLTARHMMYDVRRYVEGIAGEVFAMGAPE